MTEQLAFQIGKYKMDQLSLSVQFEKSIDNRNIHIASNKYTIKLNVEFKTIFYDLVVIKYNK